MQFIKLTKGTDAIKIFNNFGFFKLSADSGGEGDLTPTSSLVYTLSNDGTYYIVGTGFTSISAIEADTSGGTAGSGLNSTWAGGQLVIPAEHNGLPVKAIAPKAFNAVTNITEMYIYDGITTIGHRAFQVSDPFDTTMKACRLPETLTSLGGTTSSSSGRVFWGRKGLKVLNIPDSVKYFPTSTFAYIVLDSLSITPVALYSSVFQYANINNLVININALNGGYQEPFKQLFYGATLQTVKITVESWDSINASTVFGNSKIERMLFPNIKSFNNARVYYTTNPQPKKTFFGASSCSITSAADGYMSPECFVKANYIDNYSQATNWTAYFANSGSGQTTMRVYGDYLSGDTLPTQIGTTQVYNVAWYEDDDFTTLAGSTATANKEYYGKISAVV